LPSSSSTRVATGFSRDSAATWSDTSEGTFAATMFRKFRSNSARSRVSPFAAPETQSAFRQHGNRVSHAFQNSIVCERPHLRNGSVHCD
jgi:hypothetical protein